MQQTGIRLFPERSARSPRGHRVSAYLRNRRIQNTQMNEPGHRRQWILTALDFILSIPGNHPRAVGRTTVI